MSCQGLELTVKGGFHVLALQGRVDLVLGHAHCLHGMQEEGVFLDAAFQTADAPHGVAELFVKRPNKG